MGEVINLRMARKRKARQEHDTAAGEARALHGRSKSERHKTKIETERATSSLDAHQLQKPGRDE